MNFLFLNAALGGLLALVAVPILVHLFARSRPPVYSFSSVEFLRRIVRTTMRLRKPRDRLLLLLRTLAVLALALMFLQPVFFPSERLAGWFEERHVVVVVDASGSMGYAEQAQSRFAVACAEGAEILRTAPDSANLIWVKSQPERVFPEPGVNVGRLQDALRRAQVSLERGHPEAALAMAVDQLHEKEGRREIYLLSDFQRSTWENAELAVPEGVELVTIRIGQEEAENLAVTRLDFDPVHPLAGEEVTAFVEVANYSPSPRGTTLYFQTGEARQTEDLMIDEWGSATAIFSFRPSTTGEVMVSATLAEDRFAPDDRRVAVLTVRPWLRVGLAGGDTGTGRIWHRAGHALDWVRVSPFDPDTWNGPPEFDLLLLAEWDGTGADQLQAWTRETGIPVIWQPSRDTAPDSLTKILPSAPASEALWETFSEPRTLRIVQQRDPLFELFTGGDYGNPAGGRFRGRLRLGDGWTDAAEVLLQYDDGVAALARFPGSTYLWNLPLDQDLSTWPAETSFLPLFAELLLQSRRHADTGATAFERHPGETLIWMPDHELLGSEVRLKGPDQQELEFEADRLEAGVRFVHGPTGRPGLYTWEHRQAPMSYQPVNFPGRESDLRQLTATEIERTGALAVAGGRSAQQSREGIRLWPWLLLLALIFLMMEGAVMLWTERT